MGIVLRARSFQRLFVRHYACDDAGSRQAGMPGPVLRDLVGAAMVYVLIAGCLITIGVGSLRIRQLVAAGDIDLHGDMGNQWRARAASWLLFAPSMQKMMDAAAGRGAAAPPR